MKIFNILFNLFCKDDNIEKDCVVEFKNGVITLVEKDKRDLEYNTFKFPVSIVGGIREKKI